MSGSNGDKTDIIVYKTTNYKQFKLLAGNRRVDVAWIGQLKNSFQESNLTDSRPILVNSNMEVIDGQHTIQACQELNYPIYYIIRKGGNLDDVQRLNSKSKTWSKYDYLEMWCERKNKNYLALKDFITRWRFNISDSVIILRNQNYITTHIRGYEAKEFRSGNFIIGSDNEKFKTQIELANEYAQMIYDFAPFIDKLHGRSFIKAATRIFRCAGYVHAQMLDNLKTKDQRIPYQAGWKDYVKVLNKIYNLSGKNRYDLWIATKSQGDK